MFHRDLDLMQPDLSVIQHTVWIKKRTLPKILFFFYKEHCNLVHTPDNTVYSRCLSLQGQWFSYTARSLPCDKSPCSQMVMKQDHWHSVRNLLVFFSLSVFSQVRDTEQCANDSHGDCIPLWIHKKVQLEQNWHQPPQLSYQNPSALACCDLLQQWASFKPNSGSGFCDGKGLQSWLLCYVANWIKITSTFHKDLQSGDR